MFAPAPVTASPDTVDAPVEDKLPIVLPVILITGEVFAQVNPTTFPPVPVEEIPVMVFPEIVKGFAVLPEPPIFKQVIAPCPVIFEIVLLDIEDVVPPK